MAEKVEPADEGVTPASPYPEKSAYAGVSEGNWGDEIPHEMLETLAPNGERAYILDKINNMSEDEAVAIVEESHRFHADDWNFPSDMRERMRRLLEGRKLYGDFYDRDLRIDATMMRYSSPYPGVRAVQELETNDEIPAETFRAYFLGIGWVSDTCYAMLLVNSVKELPLMMDKQAVIGTFMSTFFNSRFPGICTCSSHIPPGRLLSKSV